MGVLVNGTTGRAAFLRQGLGQGRPDKPLPPGGLETRDTSIFDGCVAGNPIECEALENDRDFQLCWKTAIRDWCEGYEEQCDLGNDYVFCFQSEGMPDIVRMPACERVREHLLGETNCWKHFPLKGQPPPPPTPPPPDAEPPPPVIGTGPPPAPSVGDVRVDRDGNKFCPTGLLWKIPGGKGFTCIAKPHTVPMRKKSHAAFWSVAVLVGVAMIITRD